MAVGDIYVAKQFGDLLGQSILNVYFYEQTSEIGTTGATALWEAIDQDILGPLMGLLVPGYTVTNLEVFQILLPSDFFDGVPTNNVGLRATAPASFAASYMAFRYRSNRAGAGSRRSYKRYAGLVDLDLDGNILSPTFMGLPGVATLQTNLGAVISAGPQSTYTPIQVKSGWSPGLAPTKNFVLTAFDLPVLTSQVSRRP